MIIVDAIVETVAVSGFTAWPVAKPPLGSVLSLSGRLSAAEVGTVMAVIADYSVPATDEDAVGADGPELIRRMIDAECLIASGGLRIRDTTNGVVVNPGCCFGLENWRDWLDVVHGGTPWLGHDPSPWIEQAGQTILIWPDGGEQATPPLGPPIEIPTIELLELIDAAQHQLRDFLGLVEPWADMLQLPRPQELLTVLDRHFHIAETPDGK
jgi:hypothetical protein